MNSWKLNGLAGHHYKSAICKTLNISSRDIYKTVKDIDNKGVITTKDGRRFMMKLEEIDQNKDE